MAAADQVLDTFYVRHCIEVSDRSLLDQVDETENEGILG